MGKLNVVISDDIDAEFRQQVFIRKGMKKGNITEALEEAMKLWIKNDIIESIKRKALSRGITTADMKKLIDALVIQGRASLPALSDLLNKNGLTTTELEHITNAICQVSSPPTPPRLKVTPTLPRPRELSSPV
jgi:hypothetical protein